MGLETGTYISDLVPANPNGSPDTVAEGDNHIRLLKSTIQASFPNITGAMTSDQAELNLLDGQIGATLQKGFAAAAGTVDAITADFTPNVTLADGITVLIRAGGANTITNPTFAPDGLTAHTIVKNGGNALAVGDIKGADHVLILQYNLSNTEWELLNPAVVINPSRGVLVWDSNVTQSIPHNTITSITWDTEAYDTDAIHDPGTNPTRVTVPSGVTKVILTARSEFAGNVTGYRTATIFKNAGSYAGQPGATELNPTANVATMGIVTPVLYVSAGDYFELKVYQDSGGALNHNGGNSGVRSWLSMEIIE